MRGVAVLASVAALVAFGVTADERAGLPLVSVRQGVSSFTFDDQDVFLVREGTLTLYAFPKKVDGYALVWCPSEGMFVTPARGDAFAMSGAWVDGPSDADLPQHPVDIERQSIVDVDTSRLIRARGRSKGAVPGEVGERYRRWRSDPGAPIGFCLNPLR